mgnify:CR=1 FL=1
MVRLMRERCQIPGAAGTVQGEELECMVISSGCRSKRLSSSISMEVVAEVRDEGQNQENRSGKTGRGCREGIMLVMEQKGRAILGIGQQRVVTGHHY